MSPVISGGVIIEGAQGPMGFISTEQTGNGSEQSIAHGLGVTPRAVLVIPTGWTAVTVDIAEGTHDATNVKVTVTNAVTYKVAALI